MVALGLLNSTVLFVRILDRLTVVDRRYATLRGPGGTQGSLQDQRALKDLSFKLLTFEFEATVVEILIFKVLLL